MIDWLHSLPLAGSAVVVLAATYALAAFIYWVVMRLAVGDRARAFRAVSPGMLPPMGVLFGLLVGFVAAQVWSNADRAQQAVDREASSLRAAVLLASSFSGVPNTEMRVLVRRHVEDAVTEEWPAMAEGQAKLTVAPVPLAAALRLAISLEPRSEGQKAAQRELISSLQNALDARRQRIIVSESSVNWVKWSGVILLGVLTLLAIAFVHSENRLTTAIAMWLFATAMAVSILLIMSQDRPFGGHFAVSPDLLVQVSPRAP